MLYYVYISTNSTKNVFYTGMTGNLRNRMVQHRLDKGKWKHFAGRYYCHKLIYFETHEYAQEAMCMKQNLIGKERFSKLGL